MRKYCRCRKKYRHENITVIHDHFCKKFAEENEEIKPTAINEKTKIGFWKAVGLIIRNKESQDGKKTAILLATVMAYIFNAIAIISVALAVFIVASIFSLDWNTGILNFTVQSIVVILLLGISLAISLIFRGIANEIKAEKDRNYITSLFFGFTSVASLIVALVALFKGVG